MPGVRAVLVGQVERPRRPHARSNLEASWALERFLLVSAIAASEETVTAIAAVGIAAEDRRTRMRLAGALAAEPDLRVRAGGSARALIAAGGGG